MYLVRPQAAQRDEVVPLSYSKAAAEEYEEAKLEVFAGETHGFTDNGKRRTEGRGCVDRTAESISCDKIIE